MTSSELTPTPHTYASCPKEIWDLANEAIDAAIVLGAKEGVIVDHKARVTVTQIDNTKVLWRVEGIDFEHNIDFKVNSTLVRPDGKVKVEK